jgi:16S rRNA (adenine1518-N6/adenine1519-N6)-dimethyltransferase
VGERASRRRALGQHFLIDGGVAQRTAALADLAPGSVVLEIGPGRGALTDVLLASGVRVVAVEIDPTMADRLERRPSSELEVIRADFLRLDLDRLPAGPLLVVANLPYSVGTAIIARLLDDPTRFPRIVVMLQREVADRLCADPGTRAYGALSVLTALWATARLAFTVAPEAFSPRPRVESAVVRLDVSAQARVAVGDPRVFRRVVRAAFAQRRKTLRNALRAGFGEESAARWLAAASIDGGRRAETLDLDEFAALALAAQASTRPAGGVTQAASDRGD